MVLAKFRNFRVTGNNCSCHWPIVCQLLQKDHPNSLKLQVVTLPDCLFQLHFLVVVETNNQDGSVLQGFQEGSCQSVPPFNSLQVSLPHLCSFSLVGTLSPLLFHSACKLEQGFHADNAFNLGRLLHAVLATFSHPKQGLWLMLSAPKSWNL